MFQNGHPLHKSLAVYAGRRDVGYDKRIRRPVQGPVTVVGYAVLRAVYHLIAADIPFVSNRSCDLQPVQTITRFTINLHLTIIILFKYNYF